MAASIRKNKAVCMACRARKKRCDGERPVCSSCRHRQENCTYLSSRAQTFAEAFANPDLSPFQWDAPSFSAAPATSATAPLGWPTAENAFVLGFDSVAPRELDLWGIPRLENDPASTVPPVLGAQLEARLPVSSSALLQAPETATSSSPSQEARLPSPGAMIDLIDLFCDRFYWFLPIFHKQELTRSVIVSAPTHQLLHYAISAVAASTHPDPQVRTQQSCWYEEAKRLYISTSYQPDRPLQAVQAAVCIIFQAMAIGDYSTAWLVMGQAWRQAVALGFHQIDSDSRAAYPAIGTPQDPTWGEAEQRRRTVWALFFLDRGMSFPVGLAHAIDDRQLRINLPMGEEDFQKAASAPASSGVVHYTCKLDHLVDRLRHGPNGTGSNLNVSHHIILAYTLFGRIVEHIYSPAPQDEAEQAALSNALSQTRLALPRAATDLAAASQPDFTLVVWLNALLNAATIFLSHRPAPAAEEGWQASLAAARSTADIVRDASRVSTSLVVNQHIAGLLFVAARVLVIETVLVPDQADGLRRDLDVFLLVFERLGETFRGIGNKYCAGILYHLQQGPEILRVIKDKGSCDLLNFCKHWANLQKGES